jgi:hypothetical protein
VIESAGGRRRAMKARRPGLCPVCSAWLAVGQRIVQIRPRLWVCLPCALKDLDLDHAAARARENDDQGRTLDAATAAPTGAP